MGRVARPLAERFWSKVAAPNERGCRLWTGRLTECGYGRFGNHWRAHRVAWELAHGPVPAGLFVCHRCDVRTCVEVSHLFLGTAADNNADMHAKGRASGGVPHRVATDPKRPRREKAGRARLTEAAVASIRACLDLGEPHRDIADRFGVHPRTVGRIARGVGRGSWPIGGPQYGPLPPHAAGIGRPGDRPGNVSA